MTTNESPSGKQRHPKVFISYSWDSESHRAWVRALGTCLRSDGVDVTLDQWHVVPGDHLPEFMEKAIRENDFVIIICTAKYKSKSEGRSGGVGYEGDIMTGEVFVHGNHRKFIPVLREGEWIEAAPSWLLGKCYVDLRGELYSQNAYTDLLSAIYRTSPGAPELGPSKVSVDAPSEEAVPSTRRLNLLKDLSEGDKIGLSKKPKETATE